MSDAFKLIEETVVGDLAVFIDHRGRMGMGPQGGDMFASLNAIEVRQVVAVLLKALPDNGGASHE